MNLTQVAKLDHACGQPLDNYLERGGVELNIVLSQLAQAGRLLPIGMILRGTQGQITAVDLSGIAMPDGSPPGYGFIVRSSAETALRRLLSVSRAPATCRRARPT